MAKSKRKPKRSWVRCYHVRVYWDRTTVTLDKNLSDLLAASLGLDVGTQAREAAAAHRAVRDWLQRQLDAGSVPTGVPVSHWLYGRVLEAVVRPDLLQAVRERQELREWGLAD